MSIVLITGGAGFIGSHLTSSLIKGGFSVRILDSLSPQIHGAVPQGLEWLRDQKVEFIRGSITSRPDIEKAVDGVSHVIHLAAETGTGQSMYEIEKYNLVNSQGTALLFDVLANSPSHEVKRVVLASSRSVYGEGAYHCEPCGLEGERIFPGARSADQLANHQWEPLCPRCKSPLNMVATRETDQIRPASIYAATKYAQEDLVRVACESQGIGFAILRFQNVYGEGQSLNNPYTGILSIFSTRVRRGLELTAFEDGLETRDFVHVDDIVEAIHRCLIVPNSVNDVVNVGSGVATSVLGVAEMLTVALGFVPNIRVTGDYRLGDIRHNVADIERLKNLLGYVPKVSLEEGLRRFADWVLTQPLPEDRLDKANAELRARKLMG